MPVTALAGVRILDLADESAAFASRVLADLGADVIRVEPPDGGELRALAPFLDGKPGVERGLRHLHHNANKRSITLDITNATGAALLRRLAATADALVETGAPGFMGSLGLSYENLAALHPSLVYASVTPFGQYGEWAGRKANDLVATAAGGLLHQTGHPGAPVQGGADPAYRMASLAAAAGIMIALTGRDADPDCTGAHLDISIQECARMTILEVANPNLYRWWGAVPARPYARTYECADGRWVGINVRPDRFDGFLEWACDAGVETDLTADDWPAAAIDAAPEQRARVTAVVQELAKRHTRDEFVRRALATEQMCLPTLQIPELREEEQLRVTGQFVELEDQVLGRTLEFPRSPVDGLAGVELRRAPALGEHNAEVYGEIGVTAADLDRLRSEGVV